MNLKKFKTISLVKNAVIYCWRAGKILFFSLILSSIFKCLAEIGEIYFLQALFSNVTLYLNEQNSLKMVVASLCVLGIVLILAQGIELWEYLSQGYFWRRGNGYFHSLLHQRLSQESALSYESPDFMNQWEKAEDGCEDAPSAVECVFHILCYYIPFFTLTTIYLYQLAPAMVLAMAIILLSALVSEGMKASRTYEFEKEVSSLSRTYEHYEECIAEKEYVKETRFLGAMGFFLKCYDDTIKKYCDKYVQKESWNLKINGILSIINVFGYVLIFAMLLFYMKRGNLQVVEFATIYFAIDKVKNAMEDMVGMIGEAMQSVVRMSFLFEFLEMEESYKIDEFVSKKAGISLRNVSFSYPFSDKNVLENINLEIKAGETVAIVGDNGAGKSTLTKILIGLYPPTEGCVMYGEKQLDLYEHARVTEHISGVFQNFNKYFLNLQENIQIGHFEENHSCRKLLEKIGLDCNKLADGEETLLGKEFGGTELSGGEWQRVAIARGLYKTSDVIVLDEPTAAIDPLEESCLFEMFRKISQGKTCILVTHRMGAVKMADRIFMMEQGRIIEEGTHEQLMANGGRYKELFGLQAKWYR